MTGVARVPVWREIGPTPAPTAGSRETAPILIVGAGPVGLTLALDLGRRGHRVIVLNRLTCVTAGSKAICFAKRSLDIFDRLGVGDAVVGRGVIWETGKVFRGDRKEPIFQFDTSPVKDQKRPGFVNLQQYRVEELLLEALANEPSVDIRWGHEASGVEPGDDSATVKVRTAAADYEIEASWVIACDGSRSRVRAALGLEFQGRVFRDNFLIADVRVKEDRPSERWFWFDPPFNPGQSALMHKQPENVWRLDFQLGWDIDREVYARPDIAEGYVRAMLGPDVPFGLVWSSVYTFQCRRMPRFVHGRVIFAGDSAHLVSPFGARGCNNGIADAANLGWKLDHLLRGDAGPTLVDSYDIEAVQTADANITASSRSTDFMTPKTEASRALRDAVLDLATDQAFARPLVNSGRLSVAIPYEGSPLNTPDADFWENGVAPGSPALDAPLDDGWLLTRLGDGFTLLVDGLDVAPGGIRHIDIGRSEREPDVLRHLYDLRPGSAYLVRPDQYVAARWRDLAPASLAGAIARAKGF